MSTVQKIFVVLIFALSVAFAGLSLQMLSTEQHWKDQYQEEKANHSKTTEEKDKEISTLKDEVDVLKKQKSDLEGANQSLTETNNRLEADNKQKYAEVQQLRQNEQSLRENNDIYIQQNNKYKADLAEMTNKFDRERKRAEDLVKIYQFKQDELADVIAELNDLKATHRDLLERYKKSEEELQVAKFVLDHWKRKYNIPDEEEYQTPEDDVEGKVVAVAKEKGTDYAQLVMLSVGRNDKVKKGFRFVIFRGETYICQVVVDEVFDDMATASIIQESVARDDQGELLEVQQYDNASTRVY